MRSGVSALQQTLSGEAATVLKHSLGLARRRGHVQVTPLHVASTLLTSRTSLLRRACVRSQHYQNSHPLQCRALELCFSVALNRLPTAPGPLGHGQPSLSNALIAALKRAQASQRRGCIEQHQQQPLLAIKVELEQLIVSILDDPSVSRVMREAGFSSTAVKASIQDASSSSIFHCYSAASGGVFSSPSSPSSSERCRESNPGFWQPTPLTNEDHHHSRTLLPSQKVSPTCATDSARSLEHEIKLVMDAFLRKKRKNTVIVGDDCLPVIESVVGEVMRKVNSKEVPEELQNTHFVNFQFTPISLRFMKEEDIQLYLLELRNRVHSIAGGGIIIYAGDLKWTVEEGYSCNGNPDSSLVDHVVREIGRLVSDHGCDGENPKVWVLATASNQTYSRTLIRHPALDIQWRLQAIHVPSTGLGLNLHPSSYGERSSFDMVEMKCFVRRKEEEEEEENLGCCHECTSCSQKNLPWTSHRSSSSWLQCSKETNVSQLELAELRRKWSSLCYHGGRQMQSRLCKSYSYDSSYPWWSSQIRAIPESKSASFLDPPFKFGQQWRSNSEKKQEELNLDSLRRMDDSETKITLALGNYNEQQKHEKDRTELIRVLQENLPWQSESVPGIADAIVETKSNQVWLLVEGDDAIGKRVLASTVAEFVNGNANSLINMNIEQKKEIKTQERIEEKPVILADATLRSSLANEFIDTEAIIILTSSDSMNMEKTIRVSVIQMSLKIDDTELAKSSTSSPDHKRKAEWDITSATKTSRIKGDGEDEAQTRQRKSSPSLDLNIKAADEDDLLDSIKNRFVFNQKEERDHKLNDIHQWKMRRCFEEVFGEDNRISFTIEEKVLNEMIGGFSTFTNSVFETWVNSIFKQSLIAVENGGGDTVTAIRVCFEGIRGDLVEDGFMCSCLPKTVKITRREYETET